MNQPLLRSTLTVLFILFLGFAVNATAQNNITYKLQPETVQIGASAVYGLYLTASDNSSLKDVKVTVPPGMGVTLQEPSVLADNDSKKFITVKLDAAVQPGPIYFQVTRGAITKTAILNLVKPLPVRPDTTEGGVFAYVTLIDPENVHDIFGRRISERYIALQVTIENSNGELDYLIHDVSLDLNQVFGGRSEEGSQPGGGRDRKGTVREITKQELLEGPPLKTATESFREQSFIAGRSDRYRLSSLDLSLMRGVAEKGQGQDRRNFGLRLLRGLGSLAAAFIGITPVGNSYAPAVAMFNGPLLTSYSDVLPDYTINQMNRLSDSAYRANTLVPKGQSKAIVAFIPQSTFLTDEQRKVFSKNPVLLAFEKNGAIDFRKAEVIVHGTLIAEVNNQAPQITTVVFDSSNIGNFQSPRPNVKGRVIGRYLANAEIKLLDAAPGVSVVKDGSSTDRELKFVLKADQPIKPNTPITFEVSNNSGASVHGTSTSYTPVLPILSKIEPNEVEPPAATQLKDIKISGENFTSDMQASDILLNRTEGVTVDSIKFESPTLLNVKLKIESNVTIGERQIRVRTPLGGPSAEVKTLTIKKKPT